MIDSSEVNEAEIEPEVFKRETQWQLITLLGTASSYFLFMVLLMLAFQSYQILYTMLIPPICYNLLKIAYCIYRIKRNYFVELKEELKDIVECILMLIYKVTATFIF